MEMDEGEDDQTDRLFTFEVTKTNEQEENVASRLGINVRRLRPRWPGLTSKQVDLSMLFPEPNIVGGHPTDSTPVFLSGEKKQAVRTSVRIPPMKTVKRVSRECNSVQLRDYLYVAFHLCGVVGLMPSRSNKYFLDLSDDLDDVAVSLLIQQGLGTRFPAPCGTWRSHNAKSKETARRDTLEGKRQVDEQLKNDQPLLEGNLARVVTKRILDVCPYIFLSFTCEITTLTLA